MTQIFTILESLLNIGRYLDISQYLPSGHSSGMSRSGKQKEEFNECIILFSLPVNSKELSGSGKLKGPALHMLTSGYNKVVSAGWQIGDYL